MEGSIFIVQPDNSLVKVDRKAYDSEAVLQGLLSRYPDLLAGDQMNTLERKRDMPPYNIRVAYRVYNRLLTRYVLVWWSSAKPTFSAIRREARLSGRTV